MYNAFTETLTYLFIYQSIYNDTMRKKFFAQAMNKADS